MFHMSAERLCPLCDRLLPANPAYATLSPDDLSLSRQSGRTAAQARRLTFQLTGLALSTSACNRLVVTGTCMQLDLACQA